MPERWEHDGGQQRGPGRNGWISSINRSSILTVIFLMAVAIPWCAAASPPHASAERAPVEGALSRQISGEMETLAESAEDIYHLARANAWHRVEKKARQLKTRLSAPALKDAVSPDLAKAASELELNIVAKDRVRAMNAANKVHLMTASQAEPYLSIIPQNVLQLAYCGRRLEILSDRDNMVKASDTVAKMHLIWQNLMIQLIQKNATKEKKRFAEILKQLDQARTPDDYKRLSRLVLDEVENFENFFLK